MASQDGNETAFEPLDINQIRERLPHRYPLLMIDRVTDINIDEQSATAIKAVSGNEEFFQGHFPAQPIMPGVLTIEAMAQTATVFFMEAEPEKKGKPVYFLGIEKAKFRRPVTPGCILTLKIRQTRRRGIMVKFEGKAEVDGQVVAEAEFSATIMDA